MKRSVDTGGDAAGDKVEASEANRDVHDGGIESSIGQSDQRTLKSTHAYASDLAANQNQNFRRYVSGSQVASHNQDKQATRQTASEPEKFVPYAKTSQEQSFDKQPTDYDLKTEIDGQAVSDILAATDLELEEDPSDHLSWTVIIASLLSLGWIGACVSYFVTVLNPTIQESFLSTITAIMSAAGNIPLSSWANMVSTATLPLVALWVFALAIRQPSRLRMTAHLHDMESKIRNAQNKIAREAAQLNVALSLSEAKLHALQQSIHNQKDELNAVVKDIEGLSEPTRKMMSDMRIEMAASCSEAQRNGETLLQKYRDTTNAAANLPREMSNSLERLVIYLQQAQDLCKVSNDQFGQLNDHVDNVHQIANITKDYLQEIDSKTELAIENIAPALVKLSEEFNLLESRGQNNNELLINQHKQMQSIIDQAMDRINISLEAANASLDLQSNAIITSLSSAQEGVEVISRQIGTQLEEKLDQFTQISSTVEEQFSTQSRNLTLWASQQKAAIAENGRELTQLQQHHNKVMETIGEGTSKALEDMMQSMEPVQELRQIAKNFSDTVTTLEDRLTEVRALSDEQITHKLGSLKQASEALHETSCKIDASLTGIEERASMLKLSLTERQAQTSDLVERLETSADLAESNHEEIFRQIQEGREALDNLRIQSRETATETTSRMRNMLTEIEKGLALTRESFRLAGEETVIQAQKTVEHFGEQLIRPVRQAMTDPVISVFQKLEDNSSKSMEKIQAMIESVEDQASRIQIDVRKMSELIDTSEQKVEKLIKEDLARLSSSLIEAMHQNLIEITDFLQADIADDDWKAWVDGDRSIITRHFNRNTSKEMLEKIAQLYQSDLEFRDHLRRFMRDFEKLIARSMTDRSGNALSVVLLSSDIGKLYVALAQATKRLQ